MVDKVSIKDKIRFYYLGSFISNHFDIVYSLEEILNSSYDYVFGYYDNSILIGFIHVNKLYENMDIVNIVVDPNYRSKGIGNELIRYVFNYFDDLKQVMLEVNEHNESAISLYLKNGFNVINKRDKYYGNDNALIMKRDV